MKIVFPVLGLLSVSTFANAQAQLTPAANPNLAVGKKFVSSDQGNARWNLGLTDDSWVAARGTTFGTNGSPTFPKTVTLDLETAQTLGYVALGAPSFGSTKTVSVSLSTDGKTFSEVGKVVFAEATEEKKVVDFKPTSARYVRLTYLDYYPTKHTYRPTYAFTTELAVYAPGAAPVLSSAATLPQAVNHPAPIQPADEPALKQTPNRAINQRFLEMHKSFIERGKAGPIGVLFVGDSITDFWRRDNAKESWTKFEKYNPANFGIGGDKTQNVLWRFKNGELDGIKPKVVVIMIGTNNTHANTAEEIVLADTKIVAEIHRQLPATKVLLLGIFPRGPQPGNQLRAKIKQVNLQLAKLDNGNKTRFLDIGEKFLEADGTISKEIMADSLHPTPKGYQIWADAMLPLLNEMMK